MSASQITVWSECRRKWAFRYVAKLRPPAHKSAALGVKVHAQLERYLQTGTMPDFVADAEVGNIAASGLHHLPAPGTPGLEVEQSFKFTSPKTGIQYRGFIDVLIAPDADGIPTVLDHKTTSDIAWAKTPEELLTDTQAILYAQAALIRWPDAPKVRLQWTYFQTRKTRKSLPVLQEVTREHVSHTFPLIELGASEIVTTLTAKTQPLDLPPNTKACGMFGGCPFEAQCNLSPLEKIRAMSNSENKTENLLSRLGATPETSAGGGDFLASLLGTPATPPPPPGPAETAALPAWMTAPKDPGPGRLPVSDQPINPPEFQPPPPTGAQAASGPTPAEEPKRRGRPKGSKNAPKEPVNPEHTAEQIAAAVSENDKPTIPAPPPVADPVQELVDASEKLGLYDTTTGLPITVNVEDAASGDFIHVPGRGFTLYVDCLPIGRSATVVEKLVARAQTAITEQTGKADYRMVEYGQGAGLLSALVASYADEDIVLDSRTPEGAACKAALMAKAAFVVMGTGR